MMTVLDRADTEYLHQHRKLLLNGADIEHSYYEILYSISKEFRRPIYTDMRRYNFLKFVFNFLCKWYWLIGPWDFYNFIRM